jgi:hypothetical protein
MVPMAKKIQVDARSIAALRDLLGSASMDLGCRPFVRRRGDRYVVVAIAEDLEIDRLRAARTGDVGIEVLEELPPATSRRAAVSRGNRFAGGEIPRGLARKE